MTTAMSRTLGALFLVATFLMLIMSSCMSKEEKILDNIVNQKKAEIPYELLSDVKVTDIKYSTSDKLVTYTYTVDNDAVTGIDEVTTDSDKPSVIYDLMGRRVQNMSRPGIYIVNGKKVVKK